MPPPIVFNADHPFLFAIRDTQTGTILVHGSGWPIRPRPAAMLPAPAVPKGAVRNAESRHRAHPGSDQSTAGAVGRSVDHFGRRIDESQQLHGQAPQFKISGLTTPPAGDTAQVVIYADGTQIGQATVSG